MRILVTGASGFIGQSLVRLLARRNVLTITSRRAVTSLDGNVVVWDMMEPLPGHRLPAEIDSVVHLAQSRRFREFPAGTDDMIRVNTVAPLEILRWASEHGARSFCLVGTGTVYEPFVGLMSETCQLNPMSMHASTKLACEVLTRPFEQFLALSRLRLFFPYGPGQTERLVPDLIDRVRDGRPIELAGTDGGLEFCPTFVDDIASVIETAIDQSWRGTVNVASPVAINLEQFGRLIGHALGREPMFQRDARRVAPRIIPQLDELRQRYDVTSMTTPLDGIRRTVSAYAATCRPEKETGSILGSIPPRSYPSRPSTTSKPPKRKRPV